MGSWLWAVLWIRVRVSQWCKKKFFPRATESFEISFTSYFNLVAHNSFREEVFNPRIFPTLPCLGKLEWPSWYPVSHCGQFPLNESKIWTNMAASVLDGEKICEVAGNVRWSSVENLNLASHSGSLALYKLSTNYYIHTITAFKRNKVKWQTFRFVILLHVARCTLSSLLCLCT